MKGSTRGSAVKKCNLVFKEKEAVAGRRRPSASSAKTRLNHECLHDQLLSRSSEEEARLMRKAETACVHPKESQEEGWREAQTREGGVHVGVVLI